MQPLIKRKRLIIAALLLLIAFAFRLFIALRLPNDTPGDSRVYSQIARNVLEQHVYSHDETPPFKPSLIRLPGYPLFLSSIYAVAGHGNDKAVRCVQAVVDTCTCALVAIMAFQWVDDERRKWNAAIAALALAAICPFTAIYVATILTEVPTSFLAMCLCLCATLALKSSNSRKSLVLWSIAGLIAGLAVFFRPDSGLFAAAVGLTLLVTSAIVRKQQKSLKRWSSSVIYAAVFSLAFCLVLVPWTIRNRRVFGVFQPLAPAHGEMPGEFVPRGYLMWLRTWIDDGRYIGPVLWNLDTYQVRIEAFPKRAFDSPEERARVAALLDKYNHLDEQNAADQNAASATPTPTPPDTEEEATEEDDESEEEPTDTPDEETSDVEMTPEIDAAFGQIARERISRAPLRYYVILPAKRAASLWFDTHSQYYPFEGDLLPISDLDYDIHQQYWLPLFAAATWIYTILGLLGGILLLRSRGPYAKHWVMLAGLIILLRLGFFSSLENPEPRYVVELFPFLAVLGGIAIGLFFPRRFRES